MEVNAAISLVMLVEGQGDACYASRLGLLCKVCKCRIAFPSCLLTTFEASVIGLLGMRESRHLLFRACRCM